MDFTELQKELIFEVAHQLTGCSRDFKAESVLYNVAERMKATKHSSLAEYLNFALDSETEKAQLISALTIHTTQWLRDPQQLLNLQTELISCLSCKFLPRTNLRILSAGCSSGQEAYSVAVILERLKDKGHINDYHIIGFDIDPTNIEIARQGHYTESLGLEQLALSELSLFGLQTLEKSSQIQIADTIKQRVSFETMNLTEKLDPLPMPFDLILCRNVLIYFDQETVQKILQNLMLYLASSGILVLGTGESSSKELLRDSRVETEKKHPGIYRVQKRKVFSAENSLSRRSSDLPILIIDDEMDITEILKDCCEELGYTCKTFTQPSALLRDFTAGSYSLLFSDFFMPGCNGEQLIKKIHETDPNLTCVLITGHNSREFLMQQKARGFVEVLTKPIDFEKVRNCLTSFVGSPPFPAKASSKATVTVQDFIMKNSHLSLPDVILIGSSTGGPEALRQALRNLPRSCPPLVVVQHIESRFSSSLAQELVRTTQLALGTVDTPLQPGHLYFSFEAQHLQLKKRGAELVVSYGDNALVHGQCPAVDVLFESAARIQGLRALAAVFTGMGRDGGKGLLLLRKAGATTFTQSENSCVVYGMPRYAREIGASQVTGTPDEFQALLFSLIQNSRIAS